MSTEVPQAVVLAPWPRETASPAEMAHAESTSPMEFPPLGQRFAELRRIVERPNQSKVTFGSGARHVSLPLTASSPPDLLDATLLEHLGAFASSDRNAINGQLPDVWGGLGAPQQVTISFLGSDAYTHRSSVVSTAVVLHRTRAYKELRSLVDEGVEQAEIDAARRILHWCPDTAFATPRLFNTSSTDDGQIILDWDDDDGPSITLYVSGKRNRVDFICDWNDDERRLIGTEDADSDYLRQMLEGWWFARLNKEKNVGDGQLEERVYRRG